MKIQTSKVLFLFSISILLTSCLKQKVKIDKNYESKNIAHLNQFTSTHSEEKDGISVFVKKYSADDCWANLGVNTLRCGYQPLQITILNKSNGSVYFNPSAINQTIVHPKKVAKACRWDTFSISYYSGAAAALYFWPALIGVGGGSLAMKERNRVITKNVVNLQTLDNQQNIKIRPLEVISKVIFVPKNEVVENFYITIYQKAKKDFLEYLVKI